MDASRGASWSVVGNGQGCPRRPARGRGGGGYLLPQRAFSRAASRTHVETVKPASPDAWRNSSFSDSVTRTLTRVSRRSSAAMGGRPLWGLLGFAMA